MPTRQFTLTSTSSTDILVPPRNRKVTITMLRLANTGSSDATVTLQQVSPDGSITKTLAEIEVKAGQEFGITLDSGAYELFRGFKLTGLLSTSTTVNGEMTYKLE